jgi:hypothetical protein
MRAPALLVALLLHQCACVTGCALVHICMITSPRTTQYVQVTSDALIAQMAPLQHRLSLSITAADPLPAFSSPWITELQERQLATGPDCGTDQATDPLPPCKVRQQGLDVAGALDACHTSHPEATWILLMEDDFMPCDNSLKGMLAVLSDLDPSEIKFARFAQGNGAVAFPRENIPLYTQSVRTNLATQPCDRVLLEHWSDKPDFVHDLHLFRHIGRVSTFEYRNSRHYQQENAAIRDNACGAPITV